MLWKYIFGSSCLKVVFLVFVFWHLENTKALHFEFSQEKNSFEKLTYNSCDLANVDSIKNNENLPPNIVGNAWIAQHTQWINFIGCFEGTIPSNIAGWKTGSSGNLLLERCCLRCNFSEFVLTRETCFCKDEVILNRTVDGICSVDSCPNDDFALCPLNNEHTCLCEYKPINNLDVDGEGDCMIVITSKDNVSFPKIKAEHCSAKHSYFCNDKHKNVNYYTVSINWKEATKSCQHSQKPVIYGENIPKIQNSGGFNSVYWIAAFRKTVFSKQEQLCLYAKIENGEARPEERNCTDRLPALCIQTSANSDSAQEDDIGNNVREDYALSNISDTLSTKLGYPNNSFNSNIMETATTGRELSFSSTTTVTYELRVQTEVIITLVVAGYLLSLIFIGIVYYIKKRKPTTITSENIPSIEDSDADGYFECRSYAASDSNYEEINDISSVSNLQKGHQTLNIERVVETEFNQSIIGRGPREFKSKNGICGKRVNAKASTDVRNANAKCLSEAVAIGNDQRDYDSLLDHNTENAPYTPLTNVHTAKDQKHTIKEYDAVGTLGDKAE